MKISSKDVDQFLGRLSPLDQHFGYLSEKLAGEPNLEVRLAAALTSYFTTQHGNVCVDLQSASEYFPKEEVPFSFPKLEMWVKKLRASSVVGKPGDFRPLLLDDEGRLYLHRYWIYETRLAEQIKSRLSAASYDPALLRDGLKRMFPPREPEPNWQKVAAAVAVTHNFSVISGAPGTGKTTTVLRVLALLAEQAWPKRIRIALAAPTGKAAARLQESVQAGKAGLNCKDEIKATLPEAASTLHRLLGSKPGSPNFHHDAKRPLPIDVLVIDEASMVDLALMSKTFAAAPTTSRIILVGDKDQLNSIEVGVVLRDICAGSTNTFSKQFCADYKSFDGESLPEATTPVRLSDNVVQLRQNFRFGANSEIGRLSESVNRGDASEAFRLLNANQAAVSWRSIPQGEALEEELRKIVLENWSDYFAADSATQAFPLFSRFRILTPLRHGSLGVNKLNERIENILVKANRIRSGSAWYHRRPVMIAQNDYDLKLFNGDIGIVEQGRVAREFQVVFPDQGQVGSTSVISPSRLPQHDTVYAMTVHKSQGSEFDSILLILPDKQTDSILNRQLIYTALSRARTRVTVWAEKEILEKAILQIGQRSSALAAELGNVDKLKQLEFF